MQSIKSHFFGAKTLGICHIRAVVKSVILIMIALNSVINWFINHCTNSARIGGKSFGRQVDFHDVIYHIQPRNVDNRRRNVVFTTNVRSKRT